MKKKWIVIIALVVLVSLGGGIYYWAVADRSTDSSEVSVNVSPTSAPEELLEWKDQAGFSFRYPKSLKSNIHEEDQENYAHIEFAHPNHPGTIIIWAKDLPAQTGTTVDSWVKKEKTLASGTIFDTTFADMDGKKVLVGTPKKKVITAVVADAIVFYVEGEFEDSEYWTGVYNTITSTFVFTPVSGSAGVPAADQYDVTVDEEEVLE